MKSEASSQLCSLKKSSENWKILRKSFTTEHIWKLIAMLNMSYIADVILEFSRNYWENLMDVLYFIK